MGKITQEEYDELVSLYPKTDEASFCAGICNFGYPEDAAEIRKRIFNPLQFDGGLEFASKGGGFRSEKGKIVFVK